MDGRIFDVALQIPVVAATFLFCGWLVKWLFDRILTLATDKIIDQFKAQSERQALQIDRIIELFREHVRGHGA